MTVLSILNWGTRSHRSYHKVLSAEIGSLEWEDGAVVHKGNGFPVTFGSVYVFPSLARLFVRRQ